MMDLNKLRHPSGFLKIIELCLLVLIMALYFSQGIYVMYGWTQFVSAVIIGSFVNAIILLTVMLMGYDQLQKTPLELLLYIYYLLATLISGILLFTVGNGPWIAAGIFCLILAVVYGLEVYVAFFSLTGNPVSFPPNVFPPASETTPHQPEAGPQNFSTEAYPPPPTYPTTPPMQNVDLGNPFNERHLQQI